MLKDVEQDLLTILESAGLGLSMTDTPPTLYAGMFPATAPHRMVAVRFAGGDSEEYVNQGEYLFSPEVQVFVRGAPHEDYATLQLARACWEALHFAPHPGYVSIRCDGAGPDGSLGQDESSRPRFVFTVECRYTASK